MQTLDQEIRYDSKVNEERIYSRYLNVFSRTVEVSQLAKITFINPLSSLLPSLLITHMLGASIHFRDVFGLHHLSAGQEA
jgi:hypothetical protein